MGDSGNNHPSGARAASMGVGPGSGGVAGRLLPGGVPQAVLGATAGYLPAWWAWAGPCLPGMTTTKDPIVAEEPTVAASAQGESAGATGRAQELRIHRPARAWPHPPPPAPVELAPPPSEPDGGGGMWTALLPCWAACPWWRSRSSSIR